MNEMFDYGKALRLDGKGIVVLGAGQGIGLATAQALAQQGASVLCVDREDALAREAAAQTGGHHATADVLQEDEVARVLDQAGRQFGDAFHGTVDIVGRADLREIAEFTSEGWDTQFNLVVKHAFFALKHTAARLPAAGGSVVFVSSLSGIRTLHGQGVYGAAKAALNHMVASSAFELGPRNIRVNAVAPGLTATPRLRTVLGDARLEHLAQSIPLRRFSRPQDVAGAILYLMSDLAHCVSGATLPVDGGITNVSVFPDLKTAPGFLGLGAAKDQ
jgi:NAD(P)-dependent dehydrogenase (short-subunit alcohol dehydrogenase family)